MIAYIIIGFLLVGIAFLTGFLVMMRRDNQQLREDMSQAVPFRESQFAEPYVPAPWQPTADDLNDPNVPTPNDPDNSRGAQ